MHKVFLFSSLWGSLISFRRGVDQVSFGEFTSCTVQVLFYMYASYSVEHSACSLRLLLAAPNLKRIRLPHRLSGEEEHSIYLNTPLS